LLLAACLGACQRGSSSTSSGGARGSADSRSRAEADAARDLAAGNAGIAVSSGIARNPLTADYDRETGLLFHDSGCIYDAAYNDAYNDAVHAWIKGHGLPAGSVKPRMLDEATIDGALHAAAELTPKAPLHAPDGRTIELRNSAVHVEGGAFKTPFERGLVLTPATRLHAAFGPNGQVLLLVEGPPGEGFSGKVRAQIDPGCACFIQVLR
jgi:hypothetical protein